MAKLISLLACIMLAACNQSQIDIEGSEVAGLSSLTPTNVAASQQESATLSPTSIATQEESTPTAETATEYFNLPADSVELDATPEQINAAVAGLGERFVLFPGTYSENVGTYTLLCLVEKINFLKESSYIKVGNFEVTVTAECSYPDVNMEKQIVLIALAVQNPVSKTTWMADSSSTFPYVITPEHIQHFFETRTHTSVGDILSIGYDLLNETNLAETVGAKHHGAAVSQFYTPDQISAYINTGNPEEIDNLIVPFSASETGIYEPFNQ